MKFFSAMYNSNVRLDGKTAIVTGSNTGIGKCTVEDFYKRGAKVIMACRTISKAESAAADIKKSCADLKDLGSIVIVELDLGSMESIRKCANKLLEEEKEINLLINNAGVMYCPYSTTVDGFELQFGTNHLGHFLFTLLLMPKIIESASARIINLSSMLHCWLVGPLRFDDLNWEKRPYSPAHAYHQSKLANILFTKELAKKLRDANIENVTTYSLHPGVIGTDLAKHFDTAIFRGFTWFYDNIATYFIKTPIQGTQTTLYCALDEKVGKESGLYYAECGVKNCSSKANNMEYAKKLWDISVKMCASDNSTLISSNETLLGTMSCCSAHCQSISRLDGKTAIVTGSNTGIGRVTVEDFYRRGARVIMACRNLMKADLAEEEITKKYSGVKNLGEIVVVHLNLASMESIRICATKLLNEEEKINLLINNAGVMACPKSKTEDGFEMQFGTNHLGHFLFTLLLLPKMIKSSPSRIVNVASVAHNLLIGPINFDDLNWEKRRYHAFQAYAQSKLSNILFTRELAKRLKDANVQGVTTYALHPGVIRTKLWRHIDNSVFRGATWVFNNVIGLFIKNQVEGAQTIIYCAVDEDLSNESGLYYAECEVKDSSSKSKNDETARNLWEISLKLTEISKDYNPFLAQM
ncbi:hypothetical protein FQA39_LY04593 [Lamprigera yunnana]|nr:hypothetical protein FQA39_LY04593 [Lamprigera yunnana]